MLEVELDIFSGVPNPTWILTHQEEREFTERIQAAPEQVSPVFSDGDQLGLGYRGFIVRLVKDDDGPWSQRQHLTESPLPAEFRVGVVATAIPESSVAQWLIETSARRVGVKDELLSVASAGVSLTPSRSEESYPDLGDSGLDGQEDFSGGTWLEGEQCSASISLYVDNGGTFNLPEFVTRNNCYCFASNHLANSRFALPGRHGGRPAQAITGDEIDAGLRADGWRTACQNPDGLTIGAAVWPGNDYHFYRLVTNGDEWLWGHKPGGTPVRYNDDSGWTLKKFVTGPGSFIWIHPEDCNRGPYTDFVGFFYQSNRTAFCS